jgi:hypothetical protein
MYWFLYWGCCVFSVRQEMNFHVLVKLTYFFKVFIKSVFVPCSSLLENHLHSQKIRLLRSIAIFVICQVLRLGMLEVHSISSYVYMVWCSINQA